tara:strand:- start:88 stop:351 length:264 start_codon:yes stop_codon:yes gene_type:complete
LKKLRDNKAFGSETAEKFFVGDLVSWTIFNSKDEDGNLTKLTGHGILMNIVHNFLGDREVVFGKVLPLNSKNPIEILITNIKKIETN